MILIFDRCEADAVPHTVGFCSSYPLSAIR